MPVMKPWIPYGTGESIGGLHLRTLGSAAPESMESMTSYYRVFVATRIRSSFKLDRTSWGFVV